MDKILFMKKRKPRLTGSKFKCVKLVRIGMLAQWNNLFTEGKIYNEVTNTIKAHVKYVGLISDNGNVIYVERSQFEKVI